MANPTTRRDEERTGGMQGAEDKMKRAQDAGKQAMDKARDAGRSAGEAAEQAADAGASAVGSGMKSLAGTIRQQGPHEGMLGQATSTAARTLESGGRYLQDQGLSGMAEDVTDLIRRNPIPAVLVGVGIGFLLAQMTRSIS